MSAEVPKMEEKATIGAQSVAVCACVFSKKSKCDGNPMNVHCDDVERAGSLIEAINAKERANECVEECVDEEDEEDMALYEFMADIEKSQRATSTVSPASAMSVEEHCPHGKAKPCRDGDACTRKGCWFDHPRDAHSGHHHGKAKPCRDGDACTRKGCWFFHPRDAHSGHHHGKAKPCRDGDACTRKGCWFFHPRDAEM
jgi:hypothetical protein